MWKIADGHDDSSPNRVSLILKTGQTVTWIESGYAHALHGKLVLGGKTADCVFEIRLDEDGEQFVVWSTETSDISQIF